MFVGVPMFPVVLVCVSVTAVNGRAECPYECLRDPACAAWM